MDPSSLTAQRIQNHALPKIEHIMAKSGTPSISFAVSQRGETLHISHLGYRDIALKLQANDQTRFNINSMTKGVVAALTGIEIAKGTLLWSTNIKEAIPEFSCKDSVVEGSSTVIDTLSHRTGTTNFDSPWLESQNAILLPRDQIVPFFATLKPCLPFRTSFIYNNWGYELTGEILERRTGRKLAELLHDSIFKPLTMSRTSTSWIPEDNNEAKSYILCWTTYRQLKLRLPN
jgi:CubicO group peptidase (beta-lactamase class C family)